MKAQELITTFFAYGGLITVILAILMPLFMLLIVIGVGSIQKQVKEINRNLELLANAMARREPIQTPRIVPEDKLP